MEKVPVPVKDVLIMADGIVFGVVFYIKLKDMKAVIVLIV